MLSYVETQLTVAGFENDENGNSPRYLFCDYMWREPNDKCTQHCRIFSAQSSHNRVFKVEVGDSDGPVTTVGSMLIGVISLSWITTYTILTSKEIQWNYNIKIW